jgi:hypothetical protein
VRGARRAAGNFLVDENERITGQNSVVRGLNRWRVVTHVGLLREVDGCGVR